MDLFSTITQTHLQYTNLSDTDEPEQNQEKEPLEVVSDIVSDTGSDDDVAYLKQFSPPTLSEVALELLFMYSRFTIWVSSGWKTLSGAYPFFRALQDWTQQISMSVSIMYGAMLPDTRSKEPSTNWVNTIHLRKDAGAENTETTEETYNIEEQYILHKNTEARNERRCSCYPQNATSGACSGLPDCVRTPERGTSEGGRAIHGMRRQEHVVDCDNTYSDENGRIYENSIQYDFVSAYRQAENSQLSDDRNSVVDSIIWSHDTARDEQIVRICCIRTPERGTSEGGRAIRGMRKDAGARNERRCSDYSRIAQEPRRDDVRSLVVVRGFTGEDSSSQVNATTGACSELTGGRAGSAIASLENSFSENIEYSNVEFLCIEFHDPALYGGNIEIRLPKSLMLVNNELFSPAFVFRWLKYYHGKNFPFSKESTIHLMDDNVNQYVLWFGDYVVLGKTGITIVRAKQNEMDREPTLDDSTNPNSLWKTTDDISYIPTEQEEECISQEDDCFVEIKKSDTINM